MSRKYDSLLFRICGTIAVLVVAGFLASHVFWLLGLVALLAILFWTR